MTNRPGLPLIAILLASGCATFVRAQTTIDGGMLALRSSGSASGSAWRLNSNGYVGAYVTLDSPGDVTISVQAAGQSAGGVAPRMNIAVGDSRASFDVAAGLSTYQHTFSLPTGVHFIRTDFSNDADKSSRSLTVGSLSVSGAQVTNVGSDALALAAANTYIETGRKGHALLSLVGVEPGAQVHVELRNHAFSFGTAAANPAFDADFWAVNPPPGSTAEKYQQFIRSHFNMLVPENAGKWSANEATPDVVNMATNDAIVAFAKLNGMRFRQHNLLWSNDAGSPGWVNALISQAVSGSATAKSDLLAEINERIAYYVGDGAGLARAQDYFELDVLNEGLHEGEFRAIFGDAGLAGIFNNVGAAAHAAGADVKLYLNEYNLLQFSDNPLTPGFVPDNYANWYREHGEVIESAGGQVDGYGVQYYALLDGNANANSPHSAARMQQVFQNLSLTGKPFGLTEFGVQNYGSPSGVAVADALEDTMRMVFGSPSATAFNMWGFWTGAIWSQAALGALVDANWNLTPAGLRYEELMNEWNTDLMLTADENGAVEFSGFFGDYDVTVGGRAYPLSLTKGQTDYQLVVDLAADFDNDHDIDVDDLSAWNSRFGAASGGHGELSGADYLLWQRQFGAFAAAASPTAAAALPEPGSAAAALCALAAALLLKRRSAAGSASLLTIAAVREPLISWRSVTGCSRSPQTVN
ncbi:MAG: endo-1,4-beta-xylanase [Pirellulales bacterium]|nr:endo-1,4-beta-xylanase [Pirellulales bacterium]